MRTMHMNCRTGATILTLAVLGALLCAAPTHARDYDTAVTVAVGEEFALGETETIGGALVVTGGDATVLGRVKRDVIVVDGTASLGPTARVDGSVLTVRGTVERDELAQVLGEQRRLSAAEFAEIISGVGVAGEAGKEGASTAAETTGEALDEEAPAAEDLSEHDEADAGVGTTREERASFGETIIVEAGETVLGDVASFGGPVIIDGTVRGDVASFAGPVTVRGTVEGDIATFGGAVTLEVGSRVAGDIATFGAAVTKDPGAVHEGKVAGFGTGLSRWVGADQRPDEGSGWVGGLLVALVLGLLIAAVFPNATRTVADSITEEPGRAAGHGALTLLLILPVCVILAVTCVGLLLVPVVILGCLGAGLLGAVGVEAIVGRWVSRRLGWAVTSVLGLVAIGVVTLQLIGLTQFVPALAIVHGLVTFAVLLFGLGGALMTGFGTRPDGEWITGRFGGGEGAEQTAELPEHRTDLPAPPTGESALPEEPAEAPDVQVEPESAPDGPAESRWAPPSGEPEASAEEDAEDDGSPDDLPTF